MENKNLLIVALQVILIIGLVIYFNKKNNTLLIHIQDLSQRVDEQEDLLQKHEDIIKKLVVTINKLVQVAPSPVVTAPVPPTVRSQNLQSQISGT